MKKNIKVFLTISLLLGLITVNAHALPYPDYIHPPMGPGDFDIPSMPPETFEGSWMASKVFAIPASGATTISFDYNFITSELELITPDATSLPNAELAQDYFAAGLLDPSNGYNPLAFYRIDYVDPSSFTLIIDGLTTGPHDSNFTYETGVLQGSISINSPDLAKKDVALAFGVFDLENPLFDSAVLLDNISIDNSSSTPVSWDFSGGLIGDTGFIGQYPTGWDAYGGSVHLLPDDDFLAGVDTEGFEDNYAYLSTGPEALIPEPSTMILLGTGLIGLAGLRKKV